MKAHSPLLLGVLTTTATLLLLISLVCAQKLHHVSPDSVQVLNLDSTGYIDYVFPVSEKQEGFFMITGSPNRVLVVDANNVATSFNIDTSYNPNLNTMGVIERCLGGLLSPEFNTFTLVYSGETIGKSYIVQLSSKNYTKVVDLVSLGTQSQVLDVVANQEMQLLHIMVKRNNIFTLITFDPRDKSLTEQMFPSMLAAKMHFNVDLGLLVGIGNTTRSHLLFMDPSTLQILKSQTIDDRGIFTIDSITTSKQLRQLQIIYATPRGGTQLQKYAYIPSTRDLKFIVSVSEPNYMRFKNCILDKVSTCIDNYRSVAAFVFEKNIDVQYYALDSSDDLKFSFAQVDDQEQLLLYILPPYFDGGRYRVSIYNREKFIAA